jgi:hypothetical protein
MQEADKVPYEWKPHCTPIEKKTEFSHLLRFRSNHTKFRIDELKALSELYDTKVQYDVTQEALVSSGDQNVGVMTR